MNTQTSILNDTSNAELTVDELGTLLAEKQFQYPGITPSGEQFDIASDAFRGQESAHSAIDRWN